jgi:glycine hydroxymethyltransferase
MISNAKALGKALDDEGFEVIGRKKGYTESHTVLIDGAELGGGEKMAEVLEKGNIICSSYPLSPLNEPWRGVRFGVAEVTRYGMREPEMKQIANFVRSLAIDADSPERVAAQVIEFRREFSGIHYCL